MPKRKDYTGQEFNDLVAKEFVEIKNRKSYWKFQCKCGNETIAVASAVAHGSTKSCGCRLKRLGKNNPQWKGFGDIGGDTFANIKHNSLRRHINFDITVEDIWKQFLLQEGRCAYTNIKLNLDNRAHRGKNRTSYKLCDASLDRIDSSKGYEVGNIQWVHKIINLMKHKLSNEDFIKICGLIWKNNKQQVNNEYNTNTLSSYTKVR